jgi:hypothetical protein
VNGTVDAAATEQRGVSRVNDGIHVERGDVALDDLNAVGHRRIGRRQSWNIKPGKGTAEGAVGSGKMTCVTVLSAQTMLCYIIAS